MKNLDDLLDRLDNVRPSGHNSWLASCPAHDDKSPSLSITSTDDGVWLYCFAGCEYHRILEALESDVPKVTISKRQSVITHTDSQETGASLWWDLFEFLPDELDDFFPGGWSEHIHLAKDGIVFKWPSYPSARKKRPAFGDVKFLWEKKGLKPPLWPEIPDTLDEEIYLTEGESDCIVLRRCGLQAFAITTGGSQNRERPKFSSAVLRALVDRGVKTIYLAFDDDDVGHTTASVVFEQLMSLHQEANNGKDFDVLILPVVEMTHPAAGEKDLRQVWLRVRDTEEFASELLEVKKQADKTSTGKQRFTDARTFLAEEITPIQWIVSDVISKGGLSWISGYAKMGKSYVALDLATSITTGAPFLDRFAVNETGTVLYVSKENSNISTQTRLRKIFGNKPDGTVSLWQNGEQTQVTKRHSLLLDLTRDFRFDPVEVEALCREVLRWERKNDDKVTLIIIDPLSFSLPMESKFDINSFADVQNKIVNQMSYILKRTKAGVCVVHHQSKGDNQTMVGSVAFEASFDNSIAFITKKRSLEEYKPGDPVHVMLKHRDGQDRLIELTLEITDETYRAVANDVDMDEFRKGGMAVKVSYADRQRDAATILLQVIDTLEDEFTFATMMDALRRVVPEDEISYNLANNTFTWMHKDAGLLDVVRKGVYRRSSSSAA